MLAPVLSFSAVSSTSLRIEWPTVEGATNYTLQYRTSQSAAWTTLVTTDALIHTHSVTSNTLYYYRISSNAENEIVWSEETSARVCYPTSVSVAKTNETTITATWNAVTGVADYTVERSTDNINWTTLANAASGTTYADSSISSNTLYYYRVTPNGPTGVARASSSLGVFKILDLVATPTGPNTVRLTFFNPSNFSGTRYLQRSTNGTSWSNIYTFSSTTLATYTDTTATAGNSYYYRAYCNGNAYYTTTETVTTPAEITNLTAVPVGDVIGLTWDSVTGAADYAVYRSLDQNQWDLLGTATDIVWFDDTAASGVTYYYHVRTDVADALFWSKSASSILIDSPATFMATRNQSGSTYRFYLQWSASTGATNYTIQRSDDGGETWADVSTTASGTSFYNTIATNTFYHYRIKANGASGWNTIGPVWYPLVSALEATGSTDGEGYPVLSWTPVSGVAGYIVTRAASSGGVYAQLATPAAPPWTDSTANSQTTYYYKIGFAGETVFTNALAITSGEYAVAPTGIELSNDSLTGPTESGATVGTLSAIDANTNETFVFTLVEGEGDTDNALFQIDGETLKTAASLPIGDYSVRVRATDSTGLFAEAVFEIAVTLEPFDAPTPTTVASYKTIAISWVAITNATQYRVEWKEINAENWTGETVNTTAATATELVTDTTYDVRVRALGNGATRGDSAWGATNATTLLDANPPVITLSNTSDIYLQPGGVLTLPSATAIDAVDGVVPVNTTYFDSSETEFSTIDTSLAGEYSVRFTATDSSGNTATARLAIHIGDTIPPVVTANFYGETGAVDCVLTVGATYVEYGATATDSNDGTIAPVTTGLVNTAVAGIYTVVYTATDNAGNSASVTRLVIVGTGVSDFNAAAISQSAIQIKWPPLGSLAVNVQRRIGLTGAWSDLTTNLAASEWTDTTAVPDTLYYYRLTTIGGIPLTEPDPAWLVRIVHFSVITQESSGGGIAAPTSEWSVVTAVAVPFTTTTEATFMTTEIKRFEAGVFCARIFDTNTGAILQPEAVSSISYTAYRVTNTLGNKTRTAIENHTNIEVPINGTMLEEPIVDDYWTTDETGYNFIHQPDIRTNQMFTEVGDYEVIYTITPITGNPIPLHFSINVTQ